MDMYMYCIHYSPDGELYCSGSEDGTVHLWQQTVKSMGFGRAR